MVVVKRVLPQLVRDDDFVRCSCAQAQLCSMLSHANVVQGMSSGSSTASTTFAME